MKHIQNPEKFGIRKKTFADGYDISNGRELVSRIFRGMLHNEVFWWMPDAPRVQMRYAQPWDNKY